LDFLPTDFWFIFSFHPLPPLKRRCWLMGPRCQPPRTRNMWYLDYFADNKQCIALWAISTDKLNIYFYINKFICWISLFLFLRSIGLSCFF
jgi:hypothetical protein